MFSNVHRKEPGTWGARLAFATCLAITLATAPGTAARASVVEQSDVQKDAFRWSGQLAAGQTVEVKGVNGGIHAGPSTTGQVEVEAVKQGRRSDPKLVRIEVVPHAGGVTICAVYPNVDDEANECAPADRGRMNTRDNDVKVEFTVRVPPGVNFTGKTVNGGIEVQGLDARVLLHTVNGSVTFHTNATGEAKTVNGSITGTVGRADWTDTLELKTVNGSITLALPGSVDAEVEANTVNGKIVSDLPISVREMSRRSLKGTLGSGGRGLSLQTVNGSITLKTAS
jgi:Putative adhesin